MELAVITFLLYYAVTYRSLFFCASAHDLGKSNPVAIIQISPTKRTTGSTYVAGMKIKLRLDTCAMAAITRPNTTNHRGSSRVNQAMTDAAARNNPKVTTNPTPPVAKVSR